MDFAYYPFEHLGEFIHLGRLGVASLLDITVNKVHAITTRKRGGIFGFISFYQKQGIQSEELLDQYRLKFDVVITKEELAKHYVGVVDALDQPKYLGTTLERDRGLLHCAGKMLSVLS